MEAERPPLLAWGLGTMHAAVLMLALALLVHRGGGLAGFLGGLGTLPGLALFAWLWLVSCAGTRMALRGVPLEAPPGLLAQETLAHGLLWGGAVGAAFYAGIMVVGVGVGLAQEGTELLLASAFFAVFGLMGAGFVGLVVGALCAALDLGLLLAARRLARG